MSETDRLGTMSLLALISAMATIFAGMAYDSDCIGITTALCVVAVGALVGLIVLWMAGKVFLP